MGEHTGDYVSCNTCTADTARWFHDAAMLNRLLRFVGYGEDAVDDAAKAADEHFSRPTMLPSPTAGFRRVALARATTARTQDMLRNAKASADDEDKFPEALERQNRSGQSIAAPRW